MSLIGVEGRNCALLPPLHVIGFFTVGFVVVVVRFAGGGDFFGGGDLGLHDISVLQFVVVHEVACKGPHFVTKKDTVCDYA